jgi:hypothetical protein
MQHIAKATLCTVAGLALLSSEASAQSQYRQGAPGDYHIYRAPRFETSPPAPAPRQAAPQRPSQQTPYSTNPNGARPARPSGRQ